jgi:hypothetical protein
MLIEFRVANHRSLRDEQVLTMEAGRVGDETDPRPRHVPGHAEPLLTVAGLYGANASGKSNVLAALAFMREAVLDSHRSWEPNENVPRDPFAWGPKRVEPSLFEVMFLLNGVRLQYGFLASDKCFLDEWLHAWPHGKEQVWFERDNSTYKFGNNLKGENKLIESVTRPNALFLSAAAQHNHPQLEPIFSWFQAIHPINLLPGRYPPLSFRVSSSHAVARLLEANVDPQALYPKEEPLRPPLDRFLDLLRWADPTVVDLRMEKDGPDDKRSSLAKRLVPRFSLKHRSEDGERWLSLQEESLGTQTLFGMSLPILEALHEGGVLLVDELERSLHPALAGQIIRQFNNPAVNPKNAQIIFATHDTNLLGTTVGEPALRRDQVWLTEKDAEGATVLYPLTDYKPRKAENLERGYLQGRYGAIPFLGDFLAAGEAQ